MKNVGFSTKREMDDVIDNYWTPFMKTVVDIVTKLEEGQLNISHAWGNLKYFDISEFG